MTAPNIVFILADQLRPDFLGYNGFLGVTTPNLDRLARESVCYDRAISATPICVPARAALLTGLSSLRTGVISNKTWLRPDRAAMGLSTWPELLGRAGYQTIAVGKMHFTPWESSEGFEQRVIAEDKRWPLIRDDYQLELERHGASKQFAMVDPEYHTRYGAITNHLPTDLTVDRFVSRRAIEALDARDPTRPLALMVSYPSPHCPYDPTEEYLAQVDEAAIPDPIDDPWDGPEKDAMWEGFLRAQMEQWHQIDYREFPLEARRRLRKHYAALVKQVDDEVGLVLAALERNGMMDNTVIVFASDHGEFIGDRGLVGKKMFYESSVRVPLMVRMPGAAQPMRTNDLVELHDITATLLSVAGVAVPAWMDSRVLPHLGFGDEARTRVTGFLEGAAMIRSGPWKLTRYAGGVRELFNVEEDPAEARNLYADPEHQALIAELNDQLWQDIFDGAAFQGRSLSYECEPGRYLDKVFGERGWQRTYPARVT